MSAVSFCVFLCLSGEFILKTIELDRLGDRQPFIVPSTLSSGFSDQSQIMPPSRPVIDPDEGNLRFYYFGGRVRGHGAEQDDP